MVSLAWIHFAYTRDPIHRWIPKWLFFTTRKGATMVIDTLWEVRYHHDKGLMNLAVGLGCTEFLDFDF